MSGFVAAIGTFEGPGLEAALERMSQAIAHRGEERLREKFSDGCGVVARFRERSGFRVDAYANDRHAVVLDGLLFNTEELRAAVGADRAVGVAQLVLLGYQRFGNGWFARLDGCFAIAIVDFRTGKSVLLRDRFGHRPLYFGMTKAALWVGTEIKAILHAPGFRSAINEDHLPVAIGYGVSPGPATLFKDVYKCVPGFAFSVEESNYRVDNYFTPTVRQDESIGLKETKEFFWSALEQSVGEYVKACPDVGVLLSGGVDSALVAYQLARATNHEATAVSFGASSWADEESEQAREAAGKIGMPFARAYVTPEYDVLGSIRNIVRHLEEPTRFENAVAIEVASREAAGKCTGLLTGEGADFIFGEHEHVRARRLALILKLPAFVRAAVNKVPVERLPGRLRAFAEYCGYQSVEDFVQRPYANCTYLVRGATSPPEVELGGMVHEAIRGWPPVAQFIYADLTEFMHCWTERMEKIASASGLECFHPFYRNAIFQHGLELPDRLRVVNGASKPALRELATEYVGSSLANRRKRQLAAPMALWLDESKQLRAYVLELKKPDSRIRSYLDNDVVNIYLREYEERGAAGARVARTVFRMLTFELWLEAYL